MAKEIKKIGVLTSGGDCAGLNAAIRAVAYRGIVGHGWEVYGIYEGTVGLMERPLNIEKFTEKSLEIGQPDLLRMGGTFLGTVNKGDPWAYPMPDGTKKDRSGEIVNGFHELGLDALVAIGGDGSMRIINRLCQQGGINMVGIPKTIDNDVAGTEFAIGYVTALRKAVAAVDDLQPTARSHRRVMVLEVMGRDAGHIALNSGIAGGADVILLPEIKYDMDKVAKRIKNVIKMGRNHSIVVVSEAVQAAQGGSKTMKEMADGEKRYGGVGNIIGAQIAEMTGAEVRVTNLGHIQRGGIPGAMDRLMATAFGVHAVDTLAAGRTGVMMAWQHRDIAEVNLDYVTSNYSSVDLDGAMVRTARGMGICLGD
ncbi:MAG: ATP-dependent 6-phosphofructokinase [Alphaproteobacteria bacterium]